MEIWDTHTCSHTGLWLVFQGWFRLQAWCRKWRNTICRLANSIRTAWKCIWSEFTLMAHAADLRKINTVIFYLDNPILAEWFSNFLLEHLRLFNQGAYSRPLQHWGDSFQICLPVSQVNLLNHHATICTSHCGFISHQVGPFGRLVHHSALPNYRKPPGIFQISRIQ